MVRNLISVCFEGVDKLYHLNLIDALVVDHFVEIYDLKKCGG